MKLSTKGRYGVKAMLDMALNYSEGQISLKSIAERQDISENYLEQIFSVLRKSGLVVSMRGSQGGYVLSDDPENISIGQILRALEGSLAPVDCVKENDPESCGRANICATRKLWTQIRDSINETIDSITLGDLVKKHYEQNSSGELIYYI